MLLALLVLPIAQGLSQTAPGAPAQPSPPQPGTLRSILLEQLHDINDCGDWYAPVSIAIEGLTAEQARWVPAPGQHSVGMLVDHLMLWNTRDLACLMTRLKGQSPPPINNNDETFNCYHAATWPTLVRRFNDVLTAWELAVATPARPCCHSGLLRLPASARSVVMTLTGLIVLIRKPQGSWVRAKACADRLTQASTVLSLSEWVECVRVSLDRTPNARNSHRTRSSTGRAFDS